MEYRAAERLAEVASPRLRHTPTRRFKNNYTQRKQPRIRRETMERPREPPKLAARMPNPAEELLREWPELGAFGVECVRKWLVLKERLVEIAKVMRKFPWMVEAVRQRPMSILHPYMVEVYVAVDGSEACISLTPPKAFCTQNGAVKEVKLELEFSRYEVYVEKIREIYRPKRLLAYATAAKEYVKIL
jgi:hypothetical protein